MNRIWENYDQLLCTHNIEVVVIFKELPLSLLVWFSINVTQTHRTKECPVWIKLVQAGVFWIEQNIWRSFFLLRQNLILAFFIYEMTKMPKWELFLLSHAVIQESTCFSHIFILQQGLTVSWSLCKSSHL